MTLFIVIGALLALLTVAVLTRPLWRGNASGAEAPLDSAAVASLRQQLEQLRLQNRSGALDDAQYGRARQALERRIVDAVVGAPVPAAAHAPAPSRALLLGLAGFVCAVAAAGYATLGTPRALGFVATDAAAPADGGHSTTSEQVDVMLEKLAARLKDKPDDVEGWVMLGRSLAVLGRHEQAMPALKRAVTLRGDDAALLADYADALAMVNGRSLDGEPSRLIEQALKIDPDNIKALSLAGAAAFNRQDYAGALRHWERAVKLAPNSEMGQQIQGGIDEARKLAGAGAATPATPAMPAAPAAAAPPALPGTSVSGTVTLSPALAAKARPDDTLFVFVRAAEGPRMPLAILRKQVKDLPLSFTLDDSMAMSPEARVSSVPRVVVGARISARGNAVPQAGDLQGFSAPVAPGAAGLAIQISETVATP